ncbi:hypothetical protein AAG906_037958 [Vitis piasezkii]
MITLQDVAMILGLRIHGPPITGTCDIDWSLLSRWLREQFSYPPAGVDDVILQRYARAFILALLGGALFADKTGTHLWSWETSCGSTDFVVLRPILVPHVHDDVVDGEDHRVHSTHEPSTSSRPFMRPPSLITPVRPSTSLESPLSLPNVSIPAHSSRPETTIPSTLTPVQPSISLDAPPPITESIAPHHYESIASPPQSIAPPPVTESIAPLPFFGDNSCRTITCTGT